MFLTCGPARGQDLHPGKCQVHVLAQCFRRAAVEEKLEMFSNHRLITIINKILSGSCPVP